MTRVLLVVVLVLLMMQPDAAAASARRTATPIEHFVVLMQSGHSFDNYFGGYPGADGVPADVCMPHSTDDVSGNRCVKPFHLGDHLPRDLDHRSGTQRAQYNDGKMDGFVAAYRKQGRDGASAMGYYDRTDLPYYWGMADSFTLFDRFFSSARAGVRLNRFYWVAGVPTPGGGEQVPPGGYGDIPTIFDRLDREGVSWKFYVENLNPSAPGQEARVPLLNFSRFAADPRIADLSEYYRDLRAGSLPSVAYVASSVSTESPASRIRAGQRMVQAMTAELAKSRYWSKSAFLLTYDGWGGFYDHVPPPTVDEHGYGFRVPALLVSAYARRGHVDHTLADYTSVLKFVEDNWGLEPLGARDANAANLFSAFDFDAPARPPELVGTRAEARTVTPRTSIAVYSAYGVAALVAVACAVPPTWRRIRRKR